MCLEISREGAGPLIEINAFHRWDILPAFSDGIIQAAIDSFHWSEMRTFAGRVNSLIREDGPPLKRVVWTWLRRAHYFPRLIKGGENELCFVKGRIRAANEAIQLNVLDFCLVFASIQLTVSTLKLQNRFYFHQKQVFILSPV